MRVDCKVTERAPSRWALSEDVRCQRPREAAAPPLCHHTGRVDPAVGPQKEAPGAGHGDTAVQDDPSCEARYFIWFLQLTHRDRRITSGSRGRCDRRTNNPIIQGKPGCQGRLHDESRRVSFQPADLET